MCYSIKINNFSQTKQGHTEKKPYSYTKHLTISNIYCLLLCYVLKYMTFRTSRKWINLLVL